jgi:hypothetical protein
MHFAKIPPKNLATVGSMDDDIHRPINPLSKVTPPSLCSVQLF